MGGDDESIGSMGGVDELNFHLSSLASFNTNKFYIDSRVLLEPLEPLTSGFIPQNLPNIPHKDNTYLAFSFSKKISTYL